MDSLFFNIWSRKDLFKIACDEIRASGYGDVSPGDLTAQAVSLTSTLVGASGSSVVTSNKSGAHLSLDTEAFVMGFVPGYDLGVNEDKNNVFEPADKGDLHQKIQTVYIGYVDILSTSKVGNSWSSNDSGTDATFRTYTGRQTTLHDITRESIPLVVATGMAMGIPYANAYSSQGFVFHGWKFSLMS